MPWITWKQYIKYIKPKKEGKMNWLELKMNYEKRCARELMLDARNEKDADVLREIYEIEKMTNWLCFSNGPK